MCIERIECVIEHCIHQRRVRACTYRPAHNQAIKAVDNRRQIDFSSRKLELRNIGQPFLIWPAGTKIPGEQIFRRRADFSTVARTGWRCLMTHWEPLMAWPDLFPVPWWGSCGLHSLRFRDSVWLQSRWHPGP